MAHTTRAHAWWLAVHLGLHARAPAPMHAHTRVQLGAIIDAWALRFFHEMDYSYEARAMAKFAQQMEALKVCAVLVLSLLLLLLPLPPRLLMPQFAGPLPALSVTTTHAHVCACTHAQGIMVTKTVPGLCSDDVLVTEWVRGEKLGESHAPDVRQLCTTLLNCYLVQVCGAGWGGARGLGA